METKLVNGSYTEICAGGGKWLTQSYSTCYREWHKRLLLSPKQTADQWREADDSEKTAWEKNPPEPIVEGDDKYVSLIEAWETNVGCGVDYQTGYLTMSIPMDGVDYGFKDITIKEAANMLEKQGRGGNWNGLCQAISRINLPPINYMNPMVTVSYLFCSYNSNIQTLVCGRYGGSNVNIGDLGQVGSNCPKLRFITGYLNNIGGTMPNAPKLEEIRIVSFRGTTGGIPDSPLLSYKSVEFLVTKHGGATLNFTVHADVYAKLTGDTTNAACAALTEEERSQWAALLTTATSKT